MIAAWLLSPISFVPLTQQQYKSWPISRNLGLGSQNTSNLKNPRNFGHSRLSTIKLYSSIRATILHKERPKLCVLELILFFVGLRSVVILKRMMTRYSWRNFFIDLEVEMSFGHKEIEETNEICKIDIDEKSLNIDMIVSTFDLGFDAILLG